MRLKLYRAPGMAEAMSLVRRELGPDALILATRRVADGVEVTAALDPASAEPDAAPPLPVPPPAADPARLAALSHHGVPATLGAALLTGPLGAALAGALGFAPLPLLDGRPLLLAGPPGAGKTLTAAKLATRLVLRGTTPCVVAADGRRAGAAEQLGAYTRLLGLELVVAGHPVTLARALARRDRTVPVIIDAAGSDPFDPAEREELACFAATVDAAIALVLPAGLDPAEAAELGAAFAEAGATHLIATRLDIARRMGGILAAAHAGRLALAEAGTSPGAADGLVPLTPDFLGRRLLGVEPRLFSLPSVAEATV